MSEEKKPESSDASGPSKLPLILGLVNVLALLGLLGLVVYARVLHKRPKITEISERQRLDQQAIADAAQAKKNLQGNRALVKFEPINANLQTTSNGVRTPGGPPLAVKAHYAQFSFSLEIYDARYESRVKEQTPKFLDEILKTLAVTPVDEIATVQGRLTLRNRIMGIMNELTRKTKLDPPLVTNVYFNDFMVQ